MRKVGKSEGKGNKKTKCFFIYVSFVLKIAQKSVLNPIVIIIVNTSVCVCVCLCLLRVQRTTEGGEKQQQREFGY